jgi:hypothetical protein
VTLIALNDRRLMRSFYLETNRGYNRNGNTIKKWASSENSKVSFSAEENAISFKFWILWMGCLGLTSAQMCFDYSSYPFWSKARLMVSYNDAFFVTQYESWWDESLHLFNLMIYTLLKYLYWASFTLKLLLISNNIVVFYLMYPIIERKNQ